MGSSKYSFASTRYLRTLLLLTHLAALVGFLGCRKESAQESDWPKLIAGGSATGNALENIALQSFETVLPAADTLMRLELNQVEARGFFPQGPTPHSTPSPEIGDSAKLPSTRPLPPRRPVLSAGFIDRDGDGYGPGSPKGPDRDDADSSVHGPLPQDSLEEWLQGQNISALRIHEISTTSGALQIPGGLRPGDVVVFRGGAYTSANFNLPSRTAGTAQHPIYLLAWPGEAVVFSTPFPTVLRELSHVRFRGLTWRNAAPGSATLRMEDVSHIQFEECTIEGGQKGGLVLSNSREILIRSSVLRNNTGGPGLDWQGGDTSGSLRIVFSTLHRNNGEGVRWGNSRGLFALESSVLFDNRGPAAGFYGGPGTLLLRNNLLISHNQTALVVTTSASSPEKPQEFSAEIHNNTLWARSLSQIPAFYLGIAHSRGQVQMNQNILHAQTGPALVTDSLSWHRIHARDNILFSADGGGVLGQFTATQRISLEEIAAQFPGLRGNHQRNPLFRPL